MTKLELLRMLESNAVEYRKTAKDSIAGNQGLYLTQKQVDVVLTDFINYTAAFQGVDYGLNIKDLTTPGWRENKNLENNNKQ